jgi:hypothetical protein
MNEQQLSEQEALDQHEPTWIAQGYKLIRKPRASDLPSFLGRYVPDAFLIGENHKVIVEVIHKGSPHAERKVRDLRSLLAGHEDWRLEVVFTGSESAALPTVGAEALRVSLLRVRGLAASEPEAALLLLWATIEAVARRLEPSRTAKPQSPGRVVELLAGAGHVTPTEASILRESVRWRNRLIHGDLTITVTIEQINQVISAVESLLSQIEGGAGS